ncbi:MAG: phosphate regulon transcriptional regulatory protein PhoB [Methylococcaceae bacterium]|jgi:two-component system phosphate regulon response regulator PhoB|nr:phosphate regulon transcriptional regulatory protein PhoB [Methylococcaceae bacterium]
MSNLNILVVEDEDAIRDMLIMALGQSDLQVTAVASAEEALRILADQNIDLIVLDWMLPGISGVELARRLKNDASYKQIPIILLTARAEESDKVRGLEIGADDYMTKPFSPKELIARIRAVIRRTGKLDDTGQLTIGDLILDASQHRLTIAGQTMDVSPTEFKLIQFFMSNPDKVYSRTQLLDQVWGRSVYIEERTVDVHIRRLRKILAEFDREDLIQTVRGFGYRFSLTG